MSGISSTFPAAFDTSSDGLSAAARGVGEAIAVISGGVRPRADGVASILASLRAVQAFLRDEAKTQSGREAVAKAMSGLSITEDRQQPITVQTRPHGYRDPNAAPQEHEATAPGDLFDEIRAHSAMCFQMVAGIDEVEKRFAEERGEVDALLRMSRVCHEELYWHGRKMAELFAEAEGLGIMDFLSRKARELPVVEVRNAAP